MNRFLGVVRDRLRSAVGAQEPPGRLAAAWALGVGIALSPFLGLHTLIALLLGLVLRLNKPDILAGTFVINPWTLPLYFPAAVFLGRRVTGVTIPSAELPSTDEMLSLAVDKAELDWVKAILVAWGAGSALLAIPLAVATYFVLRRAIVTYRRYHPPAVES